MKSFALPLLLVRLKNKYVISIIQCCGMSGHCQNCCVVKILAILLLQVLLKTSNRGSVRN